MKVQALEFRGRTAVLLGPDGDNEVAFIQDGDNEIRWFGKTDCVALRDALLNVEFMKED